jgi:hypothetical protein
MVLHPAAHRSDVPGDDLLYGARGFEEFHIGVVFGVFILKRLVTTECLLDEDGKQAFLYGLDSTRRKVSVMTPSM